MTKNFRGSQTFHFGRIFFITFILCCLKIVAAESEFTIEPEPVWITPIEVKEYSNPLEKTASEGIFCLLIDTEINGGTQERYLHLAEKFLTSSGVEANSRLSFNFDPAYEKLIFHKIVIHRGSEVIDQLNPAKIRVIQQERDLDRLIYNGAKTALLFLEDVRVGDWVEYSYTIRGRNPLEAGHYHDAMQLRWSFPVQTENYRFLWPRNFPPLWVQLVGKAPQGRNIVGPFYEYAWHWEDRPGQEFEDFIPLSVFPYTTVHFTDYKTWKNVATSVGESFHAEPLSKELQDRVSGFKSADMTDQQRVVRVLQFVQDEIRYLGIENGVNSHQPTDPSVVLARGYGDCKDKALLFCTILRSLGLKASPVLVSTRLKAGVKGLIPTPWTFDHVIVQVILHDKTNYLDVTRTFQRGPLERRFIDDFGAGVLLADDSPGLITIPSTSAGMPRTTIKEFFDIPTNGPARLTVEKTFEGRDADFLRQSFAEESQDLLNKNVLAYYRKYYPDITAATPADTQDDHDLDQILVTEHFLIPRIWKPATRTNYIACNFYVDGITERLFVPEKRERKQPLAVPFPENYIHRVQIDIHEPWRIYPDEKKIQTKGFLFYHRTSYTNDRVVMVNHLLTLNRGVDAADVPGYLESMNQIPQSLGLAVSKAVPGTLINRDAPNWSLWLAVLSYSAVLLLIAVPVYRYKSRHPPVILSGDPQLQGLGGWLILLGIGLVGAAILRLVYFEKFSSIYSSLNWSAATDPASPSYDAMFAPLLLWDLFARLTLFLFGILAGVMFFRKKRFFPVVFIIYLSFQFIAIILNLSLAETLKAGTLAAHSIKTTSAAMVPAIIPLILWTLYILRSRRVKLTFVN